MTFLAQTGIPPYPINHWGYEWSVVQMPYSEWFSFIPYVHETIADNDN